ncbi:hypothetical protein BVU_1298 [Phocaeicola vulgatus ATCC 8482]|uniref:Uncharacterized protein n=1 Tax=Phocaeicola vulgatus (strain ATCC 8482 / DSM 1447 / JCM 5826 / CCUG 4940 / NBRC 14291 / NCTC 11154) TaxID=435590 RepID=A6KZX4_PHOV8|nr:hypothetical protein BVU_1298 [Phocaeicola vulgatus ATCC 8482]
MANHRNVHRNDGRIFISANRIRLGYAFGNSFGKTGPDQDSCQHPTGPKSTTKKRNYPYFSISYPIHEPLVRSMQTCHCSLDELKTNQPNLKDNQMKTTMILIAPRRNPRMLT